MWPVILEFVGVFVGSAYTFSSSLDVGRFWVGVGTGFWLIFMSYQLAFTPENIAVSNFAIQFLGWQISVGDVHLSLPFLFCGVGMIGATIWRSTK